jgi:hypothetical protein
MVPVGNASEALQLGRVSPLATAAARLALGVSSVLSPCVASSYLTFSGAEWRGRSGETEDTLGPRAGGTYDWVEPAGTMWGGNLHFIDLRGRAMQVATIITRVESAFGISA